MVEQYSKISPTAIFCARMRAKQNLPYSNEIINLIDTKYSQFAEDLPDYGESLKAKSDFIPFIEGRYYSLNDVLSKISNLFIVEIASGLSPRSLELIKRKDVLYVETELSGLIELKKKILKDIIVKENIIDANLVFMAVNPLEKKDIKKIGELYLKKGEGKKLVIVHEGLLMYFDRAEKESFRNNIKYLFEKYAPDGIWMTSDFSRTKKKDSEPKGKENIREKISSVTKREFDYFESEEDARNFLKTGGFDSRVLSNEEIINSVINKKLLGFNKDAILKSSKEYRIWKINLL